MKVKPLKIKIKEPTPSAADRMYAKQQAIRKEKGLPDPSEYKKKLDTMKSEEVEQLDELSPATKASYVSKAKDQIKQSMPFTKKSDEYRDIAKNFIEKRKKGIAKANEEVEQLDEIGDTPAGRKTLGNYINRSHESGDAARIQATYDKDNFAKHTKTVAKRSSGIAKAVTRLTKEAVKLGGTGGRGNIYQYDRNPPPKDGSELENIPFNAKTEQQKRMKKALTDLADKLKKTDPKLKESKDSQEYDYEGDMAKSDLRSIIHNAQTLHDMLDDKTNLAEWCQSKITLAEDYISTVTNYMRSEMNEEVEQIDEKKKLPGLWANIHAKRKRGEAPAKPGDKDYPKTLNIESADDDLRADQITTDNQKFPKKMSRKAEIVKKLAKGKEEQFQANPVLDSDVNPQTNKQ